MFNFGYKTAYYLYHGKWIIMSLLLVAYVGFGDVVAFVDKLIN